MLWLGGVVENKGLVVDKIVSQTDVAATIINQTGGESNNFSFSKNIFDSTTNEWAFFTFNDGFGFIEKEKSVLFDNVGRRILKSTGNGSDSFLKKGKALQQVVYQDFINK
jgi:hypothetical protein